MAFDVTGVLANASKVTQEVQESNNYGNKYKLIYPQEGTLKVRLLFNNASGTVLRKIRRHKINNQQIPCLREYDNHECPICKILSDIKNAKGQDLWQLASSTRGIAYAEYVESNYRWDKPEHEPQTGEVVMLMFPWSVYSELNQLISSAGENIYGLIASNEGGLFVIERYKENNFTKYRTSIDPFVHNHKTRATEQEYEELILNLPNLNEQFMPIELDEKDLNKAKTAAEELSRTYLVASPQGVQAPTQPAGQPLANQVAPPPVPQVPQTYTDPNTGVMYVLDQNNQWVPQNVPTASPTTVAQPQAVVKPTPVAQPQPTQPVGQVQPTSTRPAGAPECYGNHNNPNQDPNRCLICPAEVECMELNK